MSVLEIRHPPSNCQLVDLPAIAVHPIETWIRLPPRLHVGRTRGRGPPPYLMLVHQSITRSHALIEAVDGGFAIRDLRSINGTHVNGEKLGDDRRQLRDGDLIQAGAASTELRFHVEPTAMPSDPTEAALLRQLAEPGGFDVYLDWLEQQGAGRAARLRALCQTRDNADARQSLLEDLYGRELDPGTRLRLVLASLGLRDLL